MVNWQQYSGGSQVISNLKINVKELAEKAMGTRKHVPPVWQFFDGELEDFAERIAHECVKICTEQSLTHAAQGNFAESGAAGMCGHIISETFLYDSYEDTK
jgi:hypothetical protein